MKFGKLNPKSWYDILHSAGKPDDTKVKPKPKKVLSQLYDNRHRSIPYEEWDEMLENSTKVEMDKDVEIVYHEDELDDESKSAWDDLCNPGKVNYVTDQSNHVIHHDYTTTHDCLLDECKYAKLHMPHGLGKFPALYCKHIQHYMIYINPSFEDMGTYIKVYYPRPQNCPLNNNMISNSD